MKKVLLLMVLLSARLAHATYVQGVVNSASAAAVTAPAITVTSGDVIVVASKSQASATGSTVVVSSTGVTCTWQFATDTQAPNNPSWDTTFSSTVAYCLVASGGSMTITATWTITAGGGFTDIGVAEESPGTGFVFSGPFLQDQISSFNPGGAVTTCTSGTTAATTNANDLLIGVCVNFNTAQTYGAATGFTLRSASSRNTLGFYDATVSATGAQTFTTTVASDVSQGWVLALKLTPTGGVATRGKGMIY
jgi:hypothetical protein